jgi:threonylcarbamoyladenosine tRNA methylthiotransferase MtaB
VKVHFQALGCRLNEAELESWTQQFARKGHELALDSSDADLVVFNSCSVTAEADRKSRKLINRIRRENPQSKLLVTGCYASLQQEAVKSQLGVDLVITNQQKDQLVEQALEHFQFTEQAPIENNHALFSRGRHRAFIKVQDGCRYRCTFCIVTLARGEERSRSRQEIIEEINRIHQTGIQEVVITGVHVGGYGSDIGSNLYDLLSAILDETSVPRVRLASVEPWDLPDNFFQLFKNPRLMPHMHLPLQSGADSVLRRMARRCKTAEFAEIVEKARAVDPLFNITTDIIVGFPGETDEEWQQTMDFVASIGFGHVHIFSYSKREGTKAAGLPDQIDESVKKHRNRQLHELAQRLKADAMSRHLGKSYDVLWEGESRKTGEFSGWYGYTPYYHKIRTLLPGLSDSGISRASVASFDEKIQVLSTT